MTVDEYRGTGRTQQMIDCVAFAVIRGELDIRVVGKDTRQIQTILMRRLIRALMSVGLQPEQQVRGDIITCGKSRIVFTSCKNKEMLKGWPPELRNDYWDHSAFE